MMFLFRLLVVATVVSVASCSNSPVTNTDSTTDNGDLVLTLPSIVDRLQANSWRVSEITTADGGSMVVESEIQFTATYYRDNGIPLMLMDFGCPAFLVQYSTSTGVIENEPIVNITKDCTQEQPVEFEYRLLIQNFFNKSTLTLNSATGSISLFDANNISIELTVVEDTVANETAIPSEIRERHWALRSYQIADGNNGTVDGGFPLSLYLSQSDVGSPYSGLQTGTIACLGSFNYLNTQSDILFSTGPDDFPPCDISSEGDTIYSELISSVVRALDSGRWHYVFTGSSLVLQLGSENELVFDIATAEESAIIEASTSTRFTN